MSIMDLVSTASAMKKGAEDKQPHWKMVQKLEQDGTDQLGKEMVMLD